MTKSCPHISWFALCCLSWASIQSLIWTLTWSGPIRPRMKDNGHCPTSVFVFCLTIKKNNEVSGTAFGTKESFISFCWPDMLALKTWFKLCILNWTSEKLLLNPRPSQTRQQAPQQKKFSLSFLVLTLNHLSPSTGQFSIWHANHLADSWNLHECTQGALPLLCSWV